jgi:hypothetical protein
MKGNLKKIGLYISPHNNTAMMWPFSQVRFKMIPEFLHGDPPIFAPILLHILLQ